MRQRKKGRRVRELSGKARWLRKKWILRERKGEGRDSLVKKKKKKKKREKGRGVYLHGCRIKTVLFFSFLRSVD